MCFNVVPECFMSLKLPKIELTPKNTTCSSIYVYNMYRAQHAIFMFTNMSIFN